MVFPRARTGTAGFGAPSEDEVKALSDALERGKGAGEALARVEAERERLRTPLRSCNRHVDCDKADAEAKARGKVTDHCCEDCFGN